MDKKSHALVQSSLFRNVLIWTLHILIALAAGTTAYLLRFDFTVPPLWRHSLLLALPIWAIVKASTFEAGNLNRRGWSYVTSSDLVRLMVANLVGSTVSGILIVLLVPRGVPRSVYPLDFILCFLGTAGVRLVVRFYAELERHAKPGGLTKRTLIYGAGYAGISLLKEIHNNPQLPYKILGFIDDRTDKKGMVLGGVPVLGDGSVIKQSAERLAIDTILIAIPSASGSEMTRILELCHAAGVEVKTVPGLGAIIQGKALEGQIREVAVEDLLGRTPVSLDEARIRQSLEGTIVMVTGAGGSIGSELCRQIARFSPAAIVGFEMAETPLFEIDREMKQSFPEVRFHPEIGTVQNRDRLDEVLARYSPTVIYHAAAYKHVPLMETHIFEAVENNVFGTYNLASAAETHGVRDFVLISTDKAVRPTNVMGATKRVAELILKALDGKATKYVAVRFGNVLGSNGSVIPIFRKQIAAGGPVTVTHPEMRRFFMTIPEACQLVLQAGVIGESGQICVLDMGQPVRILDLAKNLILLSGLRPHQDIRVEFTGPRPGEKLYEELSSYLEDTCPTEHEKIRIFTGGGLTGHDIECWLESLRQICLERDAARLVLALKDVVADYSPSTHLLRRAIGARDEDNPVSVPRRAYADVDEPARVRSDALAVPMPAQMRRSARSANLRPEG
jgi:FlaA1/EpsC-like NDP-sugar epimerase